MSRPEVELAPPGGVQVDTSQYPLIITIYPRRALKEGLDAYVATLYGLFETRGPYAVVADINRVDASTATPVLRKELAESLAHLDRIGAVLSEAVVAASPLVRGLFTAHSWLRGAQNHPVACFPTRPKAVAWTQEQLAQRGM